ncbi:hypothetical protein PIB30_015332 [Stylosanthes scabra]|uniref:F-box domain-containing protein n=1 Tax=Stylosanthes scabra TaxID=79078 RepID=A0ABU6Q6Y4_9FABA|nr:hypothetical protein [Stylosanthes scabra]
MSSSFLQGWMDLPLELLELILQRLSLMDNLMSCRATCRSWRKACEAVLFSSQLLLRLSLLSSMHVSSQSSSRSFEPDCTANNIIGILSAPWSNHDSIMLTETWPHRTCLNDISRVHSVQGWLMFNNFHCVRHNKKDQTFSELSFFNPFSRARFKLPKLFLFSRFSERSRPRYCQLRLVFNSAPPGSEGFVVVFLFVFSYQNRTLMAPKNMKQRLAFIRFKQGSWIEESIETKEIFYDVAVDDDDKLYGLKFKRNTSVVFVFNLREHYHERLVMLNPIKDINFEGFLFGSTSFYRRHRLAMDTSTGELLLVHRLEHAWSSLFRFTEGFRVYKLERSNLRWCEVLDIGDRFLFWDDRKVSVLSAKGLRVPEEFKGGNCIFFCDEHDDHDRGVFFLADRTITRFRDPTRNSFLRSFQEMWFTPSPY